MSAGDLIGSPSLAVFIFLIFIIGYFIFLDLEGGFANGFLQFGPGGNDDQHSTYFMGIKVDTWAKTYTLYVISFLSGLLSSYYNMTLNKGFVPSLEKSVVPYGSTETYVIALIDPLIVEVLYIIQVFATITLQLQFILPSITGVYLAQVPFILSALSNKTFIY
jgi:hypothetical protein